MEKIQPPELKKFLDLAIGFQRSAVLFSFAEFKLPNIIGAKSMTAAEIADEIGLNKRAAERFLNACVILDLLEKSNENYSVGNMARMFLDDANEFYLGGQINRYAESSYPLWQNLTGHLRRWDDGNDSSGDAPEEDDQGAEAMAEQHNFSLLHGYALAAAFDFSNFTKILDVGGGTGAMSIALCRQYPKLRAVVFDLPENVRRAREFVAESKLEDRIECVAGDFQIDELPNGFDAALLANFMSVAEAEDNRRLLSQIYSRLPAGGACFLSGLILENSRLAPEMAVLFCLEDICRDAPDVERSEKVYGEWLAAAGFSDIFCRTYLEPTKVLGGYKKPTPNAL